MSGVRTLEQDGAASGSELALRSPLDGWVSALGEVPDPVFADRMMGDGLAIDPTGSVLSAPCDGEVILLHAALHAVTLRAENGAEILMHVGLDTVALGGRGFTAHVAKGQRVQAGDRLISFDLDQLARSARSLITPIVITNGEKFIIERRLENTGVATGQELMTLRRLSPSSASAGTNEREMRREIVVPLALGIHARPAARLANLAKGFAAEIAILSGEARANARSPVALMGLGLDQGRPRDGRRRRRRCRTGDCRHCRLDRERNGGGRCRASRRCQLRSRLCRRRMAYSPGVRAAPGLALGVAVRLTQPEILVEERGQGAAHESQCLRAALAMVKENLGAAAGKSPALSAILGAHLAFLDDPELMAHAQAQIKQGKSAGAAWRSAVQAQIAILRGLKDPRFVERASDLVDLERQVLNALGGTQAAAMVLPDNAILLAQDILPSQLAGVDVARLAGLAMAEGGPTSHAAILAAVDEHSGPGGVRSGIAGDSRWHGLAAGCGSRPLDDRSLARGSGKNAPPDCGQAPGTRLAAQASAHTLCHTKDGVRIEIHANLGSVEDAVAAVAAGAEGCGLLRTEFLFLNRQSSPDEAEQTEVYRAIADALGGRPLIVRTLDIGGDKPAAYLPFPPEENPALGLRGVRVSLWRPDLLATQLRAILRGIPAAQCRIMVPMISSVDELRQVRRILDDVRADLGHRRSDSAGCHGRDPGGGDDRRHPGGGSRFSLHRHQRPHPILPGDGSRQCPPGRAIRCPASGGAAADRGRPPRARTCIGAAPAFAAGWPRM